MVEDFEQLTADLPLGRRVYGLSGRETEKERFIYIQFLWLLSRQVFPTSGFVHTPPDFHVTLVPVELDCNPIDGTLMDNMRYACGNAEDSGISDAEIWDMCRAVGMTEAIIAENPIISNSNVRYSTTDMALIHFVQHLLTFPNLLLVANSQCVTPRCLAALRSYVNGGLLPPRKGRIKKKGNNKLYTTSHVPNDGKYIEERTVVVRLNNDVEATLCDYELLISTTTPTTLSIRYSRAGHKKLAALNDTLL